MAATATKPATKAAAKAPSPPASQLDPTPSQGEGDPPINTNSVCRPCLCPNGSSCSICFEAPAKSYASNTEVEALVQRVLNLEMRLKTENRSLRLQILALEERTADLESKLSENACYKRNNLPYRGSTTQNDPPYQRKVTPETTPHPRLAQMVSGPRRKTSLTKS